jgi:site-specific DNA-methyltransferase (adenine-specific)
LVDIIDNMEIDNIYNIDCIRGLNCLQDNSIDLIVTSPPYNCGIDYDSWNDAMAWSDYSDWCENWLEECYRVLKDDGRICVNVLFDMGNTRIGRYSPYAEFYHIMRDIGFNHHGVAMWTDNHRVKYTAWGSWMSPSAPYIYCPYEAIIIAYKNSWKKLSKGEATISKEEFIESCTGIWKLSTENNKNYVAAFPVTLPERCINLLTWKGDTVLDPFMGSGTTAVAAIRTDRHFIGFELSPNYYETAIERLSTIQAKIL